jgi:signal transduction histidine kinase
MGMSIHLALLVSIGITSLFLGFLAFYKDKKASANKIFALFGIIVFFWIISNYLVDNPYKNEWALFWNRLNLTSAISMAIVIFYFSIYFPSESIIYPKIIKILFILFSIIFIILSLFSGLMIKSIEFLDWGTNAISGPLFLAAIIWSVLCIIGMIINLILKHRKSGHVEKVQIKYLAIGIVLSGAVGLLNSALIPIITGSYEFAKYSPYGMIILLILTTYAITRYHLFEIRVIATQLLVLLISFVFLVQIFLSKTTTELILRIAFFILIIYFGYLLIKSVISEIERRKEIEELAEKLKRANANLLTLQHINNKMVSTLDVKKVSQEIVESLSTELSWKGGFLALINDKKEEIYIKAITKIIGKKIAPMLIKPLHKYTLRVRGSDSVIQKSIHRLEIEFTDSLEELVRGAIKTEILKQIQSKLKIQTFASAPIVYRGKVIGVLVSGFSKPTSEISEEERKMISSIADQAAIAIENAKLYQQVEKANIKLKDLDRLKNEFLSIASHQVRTPLSIIKGYISLLRSNHKVGPLNEQQDRFMKNIQEANDQLINIISDFLNLSRIEQKRMKLEIAEADVEEIIEQVIGRLSHEAELKNIKLNFAHEGQDISKINIDEPKIIEVITNLIDNAIKYSPEKNEIKVTLKKDRDLLKISVADHGIGIPRDFRDKLFQKFSRAHNAIQHQPNGNGIGLFLVKKIVDAHHGKIIVKTKEGRGTTFTVNLSYSSGLKPGEEIDVNQLEKKGIIRYDEYNES